MRAVHFRQRSLILIGVGLIALLTGLIIASQMSARRSSDNGGLSLLPPPQSMDELVDPADVIVVGTVGDVVSQGELSGYGQDDKARNQSPTDPASPAIPITDFRINVERVLLDDGTIEQGKPLILRMLGEPSTGADRTSEFPQTVVGVKYLLVLSQNPDGATYGPYYGPYSRLFLTKSGVTYSNGSRTLVEFTDRRDPDTFLADLTTAIRRKRAQ